MFVQGASRCDFTYLMKAKTTTAPLRGPKNLYLYPNL